MRHVQSTECSTQRERWAYESRFQRNESGKVTLDQKIGVPWKEPGARKRYGMLLEAECGRRVAL